ncbi:MAG: alcohol dehydrogenase [Anaerolineaceae bacterium]|nr:MAG: alcohol dehydrogenase [Anaerolineaceae bacterium]
MTLPATYQKLVAARLGRDFRAVTEIVETPLEAPQAGEIVMRNHYAGVNATDRNITAGLYTPGQQPPLDLGAEVIGEVVAVGEGVTNFQVGSPVMALTMGGGYREYYTLDATRAIPVPDITPEMMTLVLSGLTASFGLEIEGEMKSGETVLVTAAAGGTGHIAVQLAKLAGNHVIGTCGNAEKAEFLRSIGCDRVVQYKEEDLDAVLKAEYPRGVNLVYESVGRGMFDTCVKHLATRGRLVIIGYITEYAGQPETVNAPRIYTSLLWKSASIRSMFLMHYLRDHLVEHLMKLVGLLQSGELKVQVDPTPFVGVEAVVDAVDYLQSGRNNGKVIVRYDAV